MKDQKGAPLIASRILLRLEALYAHLQSELSSVNQRYGALVHLNLDTFHHVVTYHGRHVAEQIMTHLAASIAEMIGEHDVLVRNEGGEFFILVKSCGDEAETRNLCAKIQGLVEQPRVHGRQTLIMASSIGVCPLREGYEPETILANARLAKNEASKAGVISVFHDGIRECAELRYRTEQSLRLAVRNPKKYFVLQYMPVVDTKSLKIQGFEALIRMRKHPRSSTLIKPNDFIWVAEESELIVHIGKWVLHKACLQLAKWQRKFPTLSPQVSVNMSVRHMMKASVVRDIKEALEASGADPRGLSIEITETLAIDRLEHIRSVLLALGELKVGSYMDDFGTGHSSYRSLPRLPFVALKVDKSLVDAVHTDPRQRAVVEGVIHMGVQLRMAIICEGVESMEQFDLLRELNATHAQGFYFHPAVDASKAEQLFTAQPYVNRNVAFG